MFDFKSALSIVIILISFASEGRPLSFEQAKVELRRNVYHDANTNSGGDFYCGCDWQWTGVSGGRIDFTSCGYQVRAQHVRAARIEYEHIIPAHSLGHQRQCWQNGGRENCANNDAVFQQMYSDLFNLTIVIGEVNADRSNYRFSPIPGAANQYGSCDFKTDFKNRMAEPPARMKGQIARTYFYMSDRYDVPLSNQQQRIFSAWNTQYPVSNEEKRYHDRKASIMGHVNPFITGEKKWQVGSQPVSAKVVDSASIPEFTPEREVSAIRGNRNSNIYHKPNCPSYNSISTNNIVEFASEQSAKQAGYRLAGNCK